MIPYETDPTLHDHEPPRPLFGDGFSPPADEPAVAEPAPPAGQPVGVVPAARQS